MRQLVSFVFTTSAWNHGAVVLCKTDLMSVMNWSSQSVDTQVMQRVQSSIDGGCREGEEKLCIMIQEISHKLNGDIRIFQKKKKKKSTHSHKGCGTGIKVEADCSGALGLKNKLTSGFNFLQSHPEQPEQRETAKSSQPRGANITV